MAEDSTTSNSTINSTTKNSTTNNPPLQQDSKPYVAPLELEPGSTTPWRYYVRFADYHTLEAHKKAMGDISVREDAPQPEGLSSGTMTDEYRERLRQDPGVIAVWQYDGQGEWC
ncbi:hypothetical protein KCU81_g8883, partial [Aureobasidium melanogenum]|uniref:Uncharacterized protein n=1 Tax=Aureobasidium melanogenum (strain CBS 110374) TaxID=1043003 RepID=A0A074VJZ9_AURM1